jgi:hypothetical protein
LLAVATGRAGLPADMATVDELNARREALKAQRDSTVARVSYDGRVYARVAAAIYGLDRFEERHWRRMGDSIGADGGADDREVALPRTPLASTGAARPQRLHGTLNVACAPLLFMPLCHERSRGAAHRGLGGRRRAGGSR